MPSDKLGFNNFVSLRSVKEDSLLFIAVARVAFERG